VQRYCAACDSTQGVTFFRTQCIVQRKLAAFDFDSYCKMLPKTSGNA